MTYIPNFRQPIIKTHRKAHLMGEKDIKKSEILDLIHQGYDKDEIADLLGVKPVTLGTRMNRFGIKMKDFK